ncbi:hypothetical protein [Nonlabens ulvanivorans]|uniref:hypothetical protein n=1 Tax=Nonlabens ulvanivorans TaxID=906888 RepID=UPI00294359C9|nr:hypothetical protein [Nonlabens ulvanivorans]WOI23303.1 hypothetical protein R1T42_02400 [Nonlabens ulvanivorans]
MKIALTFTNKKTMTVNDLVGTYKISGHNQDRAQSSYRGILTLSLDQHDRIVALWQIGDDQVQQGVGFYKDHILVINFNYKSDTGTIFKGVVVYKCLTRDVLDGFWSEELGDPDYLGVEQAYRIKETDDLLN